MTTKRMSRIAMLAALCVASRQAFASLPNIQPITAIFLICAVFLNLTDSILIMAVTMLVSSFLLGFGPWVLWQIVSFAIVLVIWLGLYKLIQVLPLAKVHQLIIQSIVAALMGIVYGVVIDSIGALLYSMPWWSYVMAGLSFNLAHALSTLIFYPLLEPIFRRLLFHEKVPH
ncbi:ECF transporter S component [Streptococcus caprae]|uniref:ECF transporter S component n=1 Tax=Streptococcus caprae TaxID=1640501 RepID=A0ABV8CWK7_9STRE